MAQFQSHTLKMLLAIVCTTATISAPIQGFTSAPIARDFTQAADRAIPAVVSIRAQLSSKRTAAMRGHEEQDLLQEELFKRFFGIPMPQKPEQAPSAPIAQGSGFLISGDGYISTNNHVVQDADTVIVILHDGKEYTAKVIGTDPNTDIALLKIDGIGFPYLEFADSDKLKIGQPVATLGDPLGLATTMTAGIVSAKGRNDLDIAPLEDSIQTDAAINRGNSGGPLIDLDGNVVGMNNAIVSNTGGYMGIGFAIPSNLLKLVVEQLKKNGKVVRGFLGVTLQKVSSDIATAFGLNKVEGALVTDVIQSGPADKAGIKAGDVILKLNKQRIENVGSLRNTIAFMQPGSTAVLLARRGDKEIEIQATIASHPENEMNEQEVQNNLGILVQELTAELKQQMEYKHDEKGVMIKYIAPNSLAQIAGLRRGQLILSVNRKSVQTPDEFYRAVKECPPGTKVLLHVKEGQITRFITLRVE